MQLSVECIGLFLHDILSINVVWRVDPWLPQPRWLPLPPPRRLPLPPQPPQKENWREGGGGLRLKERRGRERGREERGKDGIKR